MPEKNNGRWIYSVDELVRMYEHGLFKSRILPKVLFRKVVSRSMNDGFQVWSYTLTDFETPHNKQNNGFNICWDCGQLHLVTPIRDAYDIKKEGRICYSCICNVT